MVSIIIPVYNVEDYIVSCLNSVVSQTYTDYEVILVDDCGTDKTMYIVDEFIKNSHVSSRFRIIHNIINQGPSASRNIGTVSAKGEYIFYLDSDDTLTPDCLRKLINEAERTNAELVVGNFNLIGEDKWIPQFDSNALTMVNSQPFYDYLHGKYQLMIWNKLLRRDFIEKYQITFADGIHHCEDAAWSFSIACAANKVSFVHDKTYNYFIRKNGLHNEHNFDNYFYAFCFVVRYYADEAKKYGKVNDLVFRWWYERQKAQYFGQTLRSGTKEQLRQIYIIIRQNLPMKGWNKMQIHYQLPEYLGILAYKKWHGMWMM